MRRLGRGPLYLGLFCTSQLSGGTLARWTLLSLLVVAFSSLICLLELLLVCVSVCEFVKGVIKLFDDDDGGLTLSISPVELRSMLRRVRSIY